jgi:hypothetical protein
VIETEGIEKAIRTATVANAVAVVAATVGSGTGGRDPGTTRPQSKVFSAQRHLLPRKNIAEGTTEAIKD